MQQKKINTFFLFAILFATKSFSESNDSSAIKVSGYVDAYYAYYTDSVGTGNFQKFPTISPSSNQFGLNTMQLTAQYDAEKVRGTASFHFGDIARSAWPTTFNSIVEAHAGVRLSKQFWIDAGFFRTHFGTEGLLPKENIASSISVNTFYEPYFESGIRLNYNPNDKLTINFYILNGYNMFEDNNDKKSIGVLATYLLGDKGNIGYSNYIGDDSPQGDLVSHTRAHQNLFFNYQVDKLKIQAGVDYCMQQNSDTTGEHLSTMFSGVASLKYMCCSNFSVYMRGEVFNDKQGFMSSVIVDKKGKRTGYNLVGLTAGVEYKPTDNSYIRLESRQLIAEQNQHIFYWDGDFRNYRMEILLNMGISF